MFPIRILSFFKNKINKIIRKTTQEQKKDVVIILKKGAF